MDKPSPPPPKRTRWQAIALILFLLLCLTLAGGMILVQLRGWGSISAAKAALKAGEVVKAREQLEEAIKVYPESDELRFLLGQAYRREGRITQAERELYKAEKLGWVKEAVLLERLLIQARGGEQSAERALDMALSQQGPDAGLIYEVLVPAALARYDVVRTGGLLDGWLAAEPDNGVAWAWAGRLAEVRRDKNRAVECYEKSLKLSPVRAEARRPLARLLLDRNRPDDAGPLIDAMLAAGDTDADLLRLQAEYSVLKGEADEARQLLDGLLTGLPKDAKGPAAARLLHLRGRLELDARKPDAAAEYLARAMAIDGYEPGLLYTWIRCLEAQGKSGEAGRMQSRLAAVEADLARVRELTAKAAAAPKDPAPRREIGEIFLRNEQAPEGERWLLSAVGVSPADAASHLALAGYYEKAGRKEDAKRHRDAAKASPKAG